MTTVLIPFPETRQATGSSCGASSVQAVLNYYGYDIREDKLIDAMGVTEKGAAPPKLTQCLRSFGLTANLITNMSLNLLKRLIRHKIPVIVAIQAWNKQEPGPDYYRTAWKDGHYVVAIGYNEEVIIFSDPSILGHHGYLTNQDFLDRWHDIDNRIKYVHLGIPAYGKPPSYNPHRLYPIR